METRIRVVFDGKEYLIEKIGFGDLCAFEGQFQVPAMTVFRKDAEVQLTHVAYMVKRALQKQGVVPKDTPFDQDFMDRIDEVEFVEETEEAKADDVPEDPTVPAGQPA